MESRAIESNYIICHYMSQNIQAFNMKKKSDIWTVTKYLCTHLPIISLNQFPLILYIHQITP